MRRQRTSAARLQLVEPLAPYSAAAARNRIFLGRTAVPCDPIDVLDPLVGQRFALTAKSAAVFFLWRRRPDHGADTRFAAFVCQQSAH